MPDPVIRPAVAADSDAVLRWRNDPENYRFYRTVSEVPDDTHRGWFADRLSRSGLWVATMGGQPAGCVRVDVTSQEADVAIVVDPAFRGQGIGRALLSLARDFAERAALDRLIAEIHAANEPSIALFESCGYVHESTDGGFYRYILDLTSR